jgi:hypothetical protein
MPVTVAARGLRHEPSSSARTLGSWVRIPLDEWMCQRLFYVCVVLCVGSGLQTGLIPQSRSPIDCLLDPKFQISSDRKQTRWLNMINKILVVTMVTEFRQRH